MYSSVFNLKLVFQRSFFISFVGMYFFYKILVDCLVLMEMT